MTEALIRRALVRYSQAMHQAGWVANHDGNLSARINPDRLVATPTAMSKIDVGLDDLIVVDGQGKQLAGARKPFSELALHRAVYDARPEVGAVVHAHPPFATAYGVSGRALPHPFLPEAVVSLGAEVPTVPLTAPGNPAVTALAPFIRRCDAVIIAGNGVLAWGADLELAYLRLELVEHLARIAHAAQALGGPAPLPAELVADLVKKRRSAGLAAPEEGAPRGSALAASATATGSANAGAIAQRVQAGLPQASASDVARIAAEVARAMAGR